MTGPPASVVRRRWNRLRTRVQSSRIDDDERVIKSIAVHVPALRIGGVGTGISGIGTHHAPHRRCIVPRPEVVVARLGIRFFAGKWASEKTPAGCKRAEPIKNVAPHRSEIPGLSGTASYGPSGHL